MKASAPFPCSTKSEAQNKILINTNATCIQGQNNLIEQSILAYCSTTVLYLHMGTEAQSLETQRWYLSETRVALGG